MGAGGQRLLGIIGGSGVYDIDGLEDVRWQTVETPFGPPSDQLMFARLGTQPLVFLPRHGRGHRFTPSTVNYRANIFALKLAGVTDIVSLSAVGSLREDLPPGTFVFVDQYIDRTFARDKTFFDTGLVGHVSMAHPVCGQLMDHLVAAAEDLGLSYQRGGTYMVMEGPQFSTRAESELYRQWGCSVIGMTNMPEAKLAREAEIHYGAVAMVTDFDCWHPHHDAVTADAVVAVVKQNAAHARALVKAVAPRIAQEAAVCPQNCQQALEGAVMTAPSVQDPALIRRLGPLLSRWLAAQGR
jgi:5'-methylthioadenosine phosphorylase